MNKEDIENKIRHIKKLIELWEADEKEFGLTEGDYIKLDNLRKQLKELQIKLKIK